MGSTLAFSKICIDNDGKRHVTLSLMTKPFVFDFISLALIKLLIIDYDNIIVCSFNHRYCGINRIYIGWLNISVFCSDCLFRSVLLYASVRVNIVARIKLKAVEHCDQGYCYVGSLSSVLHSTFNTSNIPFAVYFVFSAQTACYFFQLLKLLTCNLLL